MPVTSLFEPFRLGDLQLANRIVMAPMTRARADDETGVPIPEAVTYYEQRASAGLIISEGVVIGPDAKGYINTPGIYTAAQLKAWKTVTDAVHAKGGKIFAQLWHVGRISHPDLLDGRLPLAPSALNPNYFAFIKSGPADTVTPREMSSDDIARTMEEYRRAALNAIEAGFDGVEIHAANGYLIHEFLAPSANHRKDEYGGGRENRSRFLFEVVEVIARAIGSKRTAVRLNPSMDGAAEIILDDELRQTFDYVVTRLSDFDLAFLELAAVTFDPKRDTTEKTVAVARHFRPLYKGSLIINGALTKSVAVALLEEGAADLTAFGKPFVANPDFVRRLAEGLELASPNPENLYQGGVEGYIDYPAAEAR